MYKIVSGIAVVGMTVLLSGCTSGTVQNSGLSSPQQEMQGQQGLGETNQGSPSAGQSGMDSWIAGLASGKKIQCTYANTDEKGQSLPMKMYAERGSYKTELTMPTGVITTLFDGKSMYTWTVGQKQGTKMDIACTKELADQLPKEQGSAPKTYDSPEQAIQGTPNIACAESSTAIDFSVPSDVTFSDQCAMLKASLGKLKDIQGMQDGAIPENVKQMMGR